MPASPTYVGIDVSKNYLDVAALPSGETWRATSDPGGIDALASRLTESEAALVVLEATGGHEHAVAAALAAAGLAVTVVNPRQARDFAKATVELAKTDALDDTVLANCRMPLSERWRRCSRGGGSSPGCSSPSGTGCSSPMPLSRRA